jgi:hypothetical protein
MERGLPALDDFLQRGAFFKDFLGPVPLVPEVRIGYFGVEFKNPFLLGLYVKDTSSARRA